MIFGLNKIIKIIKKNIEISFLFLLLLITISITTIYNNNKILINEKGEDRSTYGMKEFWQMDDDKLVVQLCHLKQSKSF